MRKITLSEYNSIPKDYRGIWTVERWDLPNWAEIREKHMGKRTLQVLEGAQSDANYEYLCSFIITGCVGVVETWLKESDPQSPEEMAEILGAMLLRQLNFAPGPA